MRTVTPFLLAAVFVMACGKPKQADDPSNEATHPPTDDGTQNTKWDSSSTTSSTPTSTATSTSSSSGTGKGPAVSSVQEGTARRQDQYDKDATEVVLKRAARQVQANCGAAKDDSGKANGPWGKTTITVSLGHNGHSKGITVPSPYQGKTVGSCIEKAFTNLTYPPWGGADAEIQWEVELVQPTPDGAPPKK